MNVIAVCPSIKKKKKQYSYKFYNIKKKSNNIKSAILVYITIQISGKLKKKK